MYASYSTLLANSLPACESVRSGEPMQKFFVTRQTRRARCSWNFELQRSSTSLTGRIQISRTGTLRIRLDLWALRFGHLGNALG
jgi:hypothetical protein